MRPVRRGDGAGGDRPAATLLLRRVPDGGAWLRGRVVRDDPQSQFVAVMVDNDGPVYRQTVHKNDLRLNAPAQ